MRVKLAALLLVLISVGLVFFLWRQASRQSLPDGTQLVLSGVKIGRTNIYTHDTLLSKTLGRFVPSNGLSIAGLKLQRPSTVTYLNNGEALTAQLRLIPGSTTDQSLISPPFYRKQRLLISGDDGFTYVQEFRGFRPYPDGLFAYIHTHSFPRESKSLRFRLDERDSSTNGNWRTLASFIVPNPKPARVEKWIAQKSSRVEFANGLEVEMGEITVRSEAIHPHDFWENIASIPVRFKQNGQVLTNWAIQHSPVSDASGNSDWLGANKTMTNDWIIYRYSRPLNPRVPWRLPLNFALDSGFPETNLFSFIVPWPQANSIQTNLGQWPVRIGYVNTDMLDVELLTKGPDVRLTFVSARGEEGKDLNNFSGSSGQHSFWKSLKVRSVGDKPVQVHATVAIHPNFTNEFILQPRFIEPPSQAR